MPPSNIMMRCLSVASISAATPAQNHYLNFSLMINSGFALTEHIISKFSTTKQNWNNKKYRKIKHTMERKILCWICLLFTVAKCSLEHLQTLAVILFFFFSKNTKLTKHYHPRDIIFISLGLQAQQTTQLSIFVQIEFEWQLNQAKVNYTFRHNFFQS